MAEILIFSRIAKITLTELIEILYNEEYFGFRDSAVEYVLKMTDFIEGNLNTPIAKLAPRKFKNYGIYYMKYKANSQTTWYIFFERRGERFLVKHILNNHSKDFSELL